MDSGRTSRTAVENSAKHLGERPELPRVVSEEWVPAAAMDVECMREGGSVARASIFWRHGYSRFRRRSLRMDLAVRLPSSLEEGEGGGGDQGHLPIVPIAASIMSGATCRSARTPCEAVMLIPPCEMRTYPTLRKPSSPRRSASKEDCHAASCVDSCQPC